MESKNDMAEEIKLNVFISPLVKLIKYYIKRHTPLLAKYFPYYLISKILKANPLVQ